jgi:putative restriction endonuclease
LTARTILDREFPESLHGEICAVAGLDVEALEVGAAVERVARLDARRRSPRFRDDILVAYEYRCAVCGFDGSLGREAVGLDAAHVRWWAFDGPDLLDNGMCLCVLHHNLFDRGVIGVSPGLRVMVSRRFVGRSESSRVSVLSLVDRPLFGPQAGDPPPSEEHVRWHGAQVFQAPARAAS